MSIKHDYPVGFMSDEEQERLDRLMSDTMDFFFELERRGVEDAKSVLMKGTEIDEDSNS